MDTKQKYVRLKEYNQIIIFHAIIEHSTFRNMNPISAGFCYIDSNSVKCFGKSISLGVKSMKDDTYLATKQIFGSDAANELESKRI